MLGSHLVKYFHQTFKSIVYFFPESSAICCSVCFLWFWLMMIYCFLEWFTKERNLPYFQQRPLSEILIIVNLWHAASRVSCKGSDYEMNVYSKDKSKETPLSIYYAYLKFKWFKGRWKDTSRTGFHCHLWIFCQCGQGRKKMRKRQRTKPLLKHRRERVSDHQTTPYNHWNACEPQISLWNPPIEKLIEKGGRRSITQAKRKWRYKIFLPSSSSGSSSSSSSDFISD